MLFVICWMLSYIFSFPADVVLWVAAAELQTEQDQAEALGTMLSLCAPRCTMHTYQQAQIPGWNNA